MEQRITALQLKVEKLEKMLLNIMTGPFTAQKNKLAAMQPMFTAWEQGITDPHEGVEAPVEAPMVADPMVADPMVADPAGVAPIKHKRKALNWVDYNAVVSESGTDDAISARELSKRLGIPDATVRKYLTLDHEGIYKLQQAQILAEAAELDE